MTHRYKVELYIHAVDMEGVETSLIYKSRVGAIDG